jgi:hypothetical protein
VCVFAIRQLLGGRFERRQFAGGSSGKLDVADANQDSGDAVDDGVGRSALGAGPEVLDDAWNVVFDQQGLQDVGNQVGEVAADGELAVVQREALVEAFLEFVVSEPDEVFEVRGKKLGSVDDLELQLGAGGGESKGVGDVGEGPGFGETAGGLFEVVVYQGGTEYQTAGNSDVIGGETLAAGGFDGDELAFGRGGLWGTGTQGWRGLQTAGNAGSDQQSEQKGEKDGQQWTRALGL